jgi:hypothetical protein
MQVAKGWWGALVLVLVVSGVAGTAYKVLAPDGWIAAAFDRSTTAGLAAIGAVGLVGTLAWISRGVAIRGRNRYAEAFVYAFATAGLVYVTRFWIHGTF